MNFETIEQYLLDWYLTSAVDEAISDETVNYYDLTIQKQKEAIEKKEQKQKILDTSKPIENKKEKDFFLSQSQENIIKTTKESLKEISNLDELEKFLQNFEGCPLKNTAKNTVFGGGNPKSKIMLIGEAPGADEDRQGIPFVGRSGQLLDKILLAIGITRQDCFISNIIPWRPPGNRKPSISEVSVCLPFIKKIMDIISPEIVVLLGASSYNAIFNESASISRTRGKWFEYELDSGNKTSIIATYHPAYLLRSPKQKQKVWLDFLKIKEKLDKNKI